MSDNQWPLWEVFIRSKQGLNHKHVGSLHATDAFFEPAKSKIYRHPTFYNLPEEVKHI